MIKVSTSLFIVFILIGCTSQLRPMSEEDKKSILDDFIMHERWVGGFNYIDNSYLMSSKVDVARDYFSKYPQLISDGGVKSYKKGCAYQSKHVFERRERALLKLSGMGGEPVDELLKIINKCESERIAKHKQEIIDKQLAAKLAADKQAIDAFNKQVALEAKLKEMREREAAAAKATEIEQRPFLIKLDAAKKGAKIQCIDNCDRLFAVAQIFVNEYSNMKIQTYTDVIVETYAPRDNGQIGMTVYKIPSTEKMPGVISLKVSCKAERHNRFKLCVKNETAMYTEFKNVVGSY